MHGRSVCLILFAAVLFIAGNTVYAAGALVAHWPFDGDGRDTSGNRNDATVSGNVVFAAGMSGQAVQFDAAGEYLQVPNNPGMQLLSGKGFSVAAYAKPANANHGNILIHGLGCSTWASWFLGVQGGEPDAALSPGKFVFGVRSAGGSAYTGAIGDVITGEWVHVAATHNGTTLKLFVNGQEQDSQSAPLPFNSTESLYMGGDPGCGGRSWYTGAVDEVYIFSRSMNAEQVQGLAGGALPAWVKAESPNPADGAVGVTMPLLQWSKGDTAVFHNVYLGTTPDLTEANLVSPRLPFTMYYHAVGLQPGVTYYWRVDEVEASGAIQTGNVWRFTSAPSTAYAPSPRSGDKWIAVDVILAWLTGQGATAHEVYFGTDKDAVASRDAGVFKGKQVAPSYTPGALSENTTYYWAVDEITGTGTKNVGDLWSFTTVTPGGGVKGEYFNGMTPGGVPGLTRIDPTIDFSWGDPGGPGTPIGVDQFSARWTADLEIAVADSYIFTTNSDDGSRLWLNDQLIVNQWVDQGPTDASSRPIALAPGIYPLRMEYYENGGGAVAHLFWQSPSMARQIIPAGPLQPPVRARALYPADGDVNIPQDVTLRWSAGEKALQHQVYFGEDKEAVANATPDSAGIYKGEQALDATSFSPGSLEWNKTYYWRIDEVNDTATDSPWKGAVWSFTTADFIVVDNFESYNDEADKGTRIYETWVDGLTNQTTSTVGNWDPPFAEQTIVHSGKQSMPMDYNNINSPYYAEAEREFPPLQNWTVNGVTDLTLFFRGRPAAFVEGADGVITMSGSGHDIWDEADDCRLAYKRLNGDGSIVVKVDSVANTNTWAKAGVMIRETLDGGSRMVYMVVTPGNGVSFGWRAFVDATPEQVNKTGITAPQWVKLTRKGDVFTAQYSADGKAWTDLPKADGTPVSVLLTGSSAYIGLCVTSHDAALITTAAFSNITAGGTGPWQVAAVGDDPEPANSPQSLYLVVEDSAGKSKVIAHPDAAVNVTEWTEWKIPLSDLAGVNLAKVKKLYIGVGDRANPAADGSGRIYIDDIRVTKP